MRRHCTVGISNWDVDLTIKNYRCFPDTNPLSIQLRDDVVVLIGPNNSGKSSILKFFYEFRELFRMMDGLSGNFLNALRGRDERFGLLRDVADPAELFSNSNNRALEFEVTFRQNETAAGDQAPETPSKIRIMVPRGPFRPHDGLLWQPTVFLRGKELSPQGFQFDKVADGRLRVLHEQKPYKIVDLNPVTAVFHDLRNSLYIGSFRNIINVTADRPYFDINVGRALVNQWDERKAAGPKLPANTAIRLTDDIGRIFGFKRLEISASANSETLQLVIDNRPYRLDEVGSGIAQFIVVLANTAMKSPSYILIDEPEMSLHPQLHLDFLTTLASYTQRGTLFATHSIGVARSAADRIYSLRRVSEETTEVRDYDETPRLSQFLGELSFSGYQELGYDKVLLVEGKHDVKTLHQFLRLHRKDHKTVVLPLGGAQLISGQAEGQLEELKRLSANISAIVDSDRPDKDSPPAANVQAFKRLCDRAEIDCLVLQRREIENYLTEAAIKSVKGEKYRALEPYEALNDVRPGWGQHENWRIAREMTIEDLQDTDLGAFLKNL